MKRFRTAEKFKVLILAIMALLVSSCATVHSGTVDLSLKLEQQLYALKKTNEELVNYLYDSKEEAAIIHIDSKWYPDYLSSFFELPAIANEWNKIVETSDLQERISKISVIAKVTSIAYNKYKDGVFEKINSDRRKHLKSINEAYDLAIKMNATITRNISSVKALEKEYHKYAPTTNFEKEMEDIRSIASEGIDKYLNKVESGLDKLDENREKIESVIHKIKE